MRTHASSDSAVPLSTGDLARAFRKHPFSMLVATAFGAGLTPIAPGTAGSIVGLVLGWLLVLALAPPHETSIAAAVGLLASGLAVAAIGIPCATRAERALGARDPGCIVIDEVAGQLLACAPLPLFVYGSRGREAAFWGGAFVLFRLFDVWKPGPIAKAQDLPEGWGVVIDDVLAGLLAAAFVVLAGRAFAAG